MRIIRILVTNRWKFTIVETKGGRTQYATMSDKTGWRINLVPRLAGAPVIPLLPPDVTQEYCMPFITSEDNIKGQVINCIREVSRVSKWVNDKVYGMEMTDAGIVCFTDGVDLADVKWKE